MGRWVQRDAQTWWTIVQRQMESGRSQVAFCAAEGLSVSSLQNWKRKFVREGRASGSSRVSSRCSRVPLRALALCPNPKSQSTGIPWTRRVDYIA
jgi:transposase-like protein